MQRLPSSVPLFIAVFIALSIPLSAFSDQFDWQYNRLGTPFAVFYNPSLLGNNPGHTIGVDIVSDSTGYGLRGALTIPIGKVKERKVKKSAWLNSPYHSYRSSRGAISVGGMYDSQENYQISAGFTVPLWFIQSGASVDLANRNENTVTSLNLALMSNVIADNILYFGINNLVANERDGANDLNLYIGTAGPAAYRGPLYHIPYELRFACNLKDNRINLTEGTVRANLDLTRLHTSAGTVGQLPAASLGYTLSRARGGDVSHKIFANFGITFINRLSSAAVLGGYSHRESRGSEGSVAFSYSLLDGSSISTEADENMAAALSCRSEGGGVLFSLSASGASISSWVLRIENRTGVVVRTFSGGNVVPSSILWDGKNGDGSAPDAEYISAKLVIKGQMRVVESNLVEIPLK